MRYLRKSELEPLAVSMCGLKLGHRFLVIGTSDPELVWRLAGKVGLTGRACLLDESADRTSATAAAVEQQGALVESFTAPFTSLPFEAGAFDAVVMRNALAALEQSRRAATVGEVFRVLRPGGRCIAVEDLPKSGIRALITGRAGGTPSAGAIAVELLTTAGFRGVRLLAEREGIAFVEGVKAAGHAD
jgi:demethylmenaquinone methyltransferase/2-methoxy-6-polyprenyl-1,4-benzoquinol methylase